MSFGDRVLSGLKAIVLIEERTKVLDDALRSIKTKVETSMADHERRLIRLETMVEIARTDGSLLRIAPGSPPSDK